MEEGLSRIVEELSKPDYAGIVIGVLTSIGTIAAAIVAAISAKAASKAANLSRKSVELQEKQLKLQNRQSLFEKRLDNYIHCKTFYDLIEENLENLDIKSETSYQLNIDMEFIWITNTDYFEKSPRLIFDLNNEEYRYKFLQKLEDLKAIAEKSSILFPNDEGASIKKFVLAYRRVISAMYKYADLIDTMDNDPMDRSIKELYASGARPLESPKTFEELSKEYGEGKWRKELLESINDLRESFNTLRRKKILDKVKNRVTLGKD